MMSRCPALWLILAVATARPPRTTEMAPLLEGPCWRRAADRFREDKSLVAVVPEQDQPCRAFRDADKKAMALLLTSCHLESRGENQLSERCGTQSEAEIESCLRSLSDFQFQLYLEFYNHLESVCFHVHSALWQDRAEFLINDLAVTAGSVVEQLGEAQEQNSRLLETQRRTLESVLNSSDELHAAISVGHQDLQHTFHDIKEEVSQEHQKVLKIFNEIFESFQRLIGFQRFIRDKIFDLQSAILYGALVLLSHYLTATPRLRGCRAELYLTWTGMAGTEALMIRAAPLIADVYGTLGLIANPLHRMICTADWRRVAPQLMLAFCGASDVGWAETDSIAVAKHLIRRLRFLCLGCAAWLVCRSYWLYQAPEQAALKAVTDHIERLHSRLEKRVLRPVLVAGDPLACLTNEGGAGRKLPRSVGHQHKTFADKLRRDPGLRSRLVAEDPAMFAQRIQCNALAARLTTVMEG